MALRKYARRVCGLRMLAVKYSAKRVTASSPAEVRMKGSGTVAAVRVERPGSTVVSSLLPVNGSVPSSLIL